MPSKTVSVETTINTIGQGKLLLVPTALTVSYGYQDLIGLLAGKIASIQIFERNSLAFHLVPDRDGEIIQNMGLQSTRYILMANLTTSSAKTVLDSLAVGVLYNLQLPLWQNVWISVRARLDSIGEVRPSAGPSGAFLPIVLTLVEDPAMYDYMLASIASMIRCYPHHIQSISIASNIRCYEHEIKSISISTDTDCYEPEQKVASVSTVVDSYEE